MLHVWNIYPTLISYIWAKNCRYKSSIHPSHMGAICITCGNYTVIAGNIRYHSKEPSDLVRCFPNRINPGCGSMINGWNGHLKRENSTKMQKLVKIKEQIGWLVGGWTTHFKNMLVKMDHFTQVGVKIKYLKSPPKWFHVYNISRLRRRLFGIRSSATAKRCGSHKKKMGHLLKEPVISEQHYRNK